MKRLPYFVLGITLFSILSTGCGKKQNFVPPPFPQQNVQQTAQLPPNPALQQVEQPAPPAVQANDTGLPESPDVSTVSPNNAPEKAVNSTANSKLATAGSPAAGATDDKLMNSEEMGALPEIAPSVAPSAEPSAPPPKVPWYKKVVSKVKSIFSKSSS